MNFSHVNRQAYIDELKSTTFETLIIGGGITGAGVALQLAASGVKTALIDMQDFAEGTSSRSTKLVHGGIRYLKTFDVDVVSDTVTERAKIQKIAPHIPRPSKMLLPLYAEPGQTFTPLSAQLATKVYDDLAHVPAGSEFAHQYLTAEEAMDLVPNLKKENLIGMAIYLDYQNNDARLVIENMKRAVEDGAVAVSRLKAAHVEKTADGFTVSVADQLSDQTFTIKAKTLVNAGGPWSDQVDKLAGEERHMIRATKGVHLVVDGGKLSVPSTVYFDSGLQDDRMLFVIPREGKTYFGTTDTDYTGDFAHPQVDKADVDYILAVMNGRFPDAHLTIDDIEASWAGLRPLIGDSDYNGNASQSKSLNDADLTALRDAIDDHLNNGADTTAVETALENLDGDQGGTAASALSRGFEIDLTDGKMDIKGGKLTDYRLMAEHAVAELKPTLEERLGRKIDLVDSENYAISGGDFDNTDVAGALAKYVDELMNAGLPADDAAYVANFYGTNAAKIAEYVKEGVVFDGLSLAETSMLRYALDNEVVVSPVDFLLRRTNYLLFKADTLDRVEGPVFDAFAREFAWSDAELAEAHRYYDDVKANAQLAHLKEA